MYNKERKKQYDIAYAKKNLKRIPLNVRLDKYDEIKQHAESCGENVSEYIKKAIEERMKRDKVDEGNT